jgi:hypothetical protein
MYLQAHRKRQAARGHTFWRARFPPQNCCIPQQQKRMMRQPELNPEFPTESFPIEQHRRHLQKES